MCGISGVAVPRQRGFEIDVEAVEKMSAALTHRGPDDSGVVVDGNVALANRRLSIVDLPGGHQPMTSEDGSLIVTYNGEVYNAPALRKELERKGRRYRTNCDTEAVLQTYAEHGKDAVHRLRGCYAFALWDRESHELLLVRDRLGVRPLYYVHGADGTIAFASEIKALLAGGAARPELNFPGLACHLANGATYGEETIFVGVRRVPAGHFLCWRDGEIRTEQYWDVGALPADDTRSDDDYIEEWSALFRESVKLRLMADVPIGVLLSGGVDSSAIAAVMSELTGEPIRTFSIAFPEHEGNELRYSRLVADQIGSVHRELTLTGREYFDAVPHVAWHADEPMSHPSSVPHYFVSRLAASDVKAVLGGEGCDETLAGYPRYRITLYNLALGQSYERLTTAPLRRMVGRRVRSLPPTSRNGQRLSQTFLARPSDLRHLYLDNFAHFGSDALSRMLTPETAAKVGSRDPHAEKQALLDAHPDADLLQRMLYVDQKTHLDSLLMKQDKMGMAASLETRVPFLDHELVELSARLPRHLKIHHGWNMKYVLKRSMSGMLPTPILARRKRGFPVPLDRWFRGPFRSVLDEYVLGDRVRQRGLFEHDYLGRLVRAHEGGARHGYRLWVLVGLELWARRFIDGEEPAV
jgi:asparagine synthase (glutamine-hydrolysing)